MDWSGTVWVITGASSGLGRRTATDVAAAGAQVCVAARREERLRALVDELPGSGHSYHVTDVSKRDEVAALAKHVEATHGRCSVLLNNAGIPGPRGFWGPDAIEDLEALMATNFFGAINCIGEFMPLLERSAPANIVNVTSVAGRIATPGMPAYAASKFALVGWTESVAAEFARKKIYVSSVEPGFIPTEGFPQTEMTGDPMMRRLLGTEAQVSEAIQDAVKHRKVQRVVPRFYYLAQVPEVTAPRLFRSVMTKLAGVRESRGR
ncbi:MAG TPA: SDR family oxidoreductase [Actinomycetota bacterium]|nr:SDR family oxidoreductase [Actinomycetota bacterium]